jgi:hypothetical protein
MFWERGTRGVAGVDNDYGPDVGSSFTRGGEGGLDGGELGAPIGRFVQEVGDAGCVEDGERGSVERVLGNGDEDAGLRAGADDVENSVDT